MTMGRRDPMRHAPYSCRQVPRPATNSPAWITAADWVEFIFAAEATMKIGARFATNIAITCCRPNGMPFQNDTGASKEVNASMEIPLFFFFSAIVSSLF